MKALIAGLTMAVIAAGAVTTDAVAPQPASAAVVVVHVGPGHYRWRGRYYRYRWNGRYYNYYWGGRYYMTRFYCVRHRRRVWCYR